MVNRRSISDAVAVKPDIEAFIRGGVPGVVKEIAQVKEPPTREEESVVVDLQVADTKPRTKVRRQRRGESREEREGEASLLDDILVPLTTKLKRKTVQALRRAYLEQKLAGRKPATQQEIIEEAVGEWLGRNGFGFA